MAKARTALVTGSNGFIGSHLVPALLKEGWRVRCLLRKERSGQLFLRQRIESVTGDLADRESLKKALPGIDWVFHLAGRIKGKTRESYFQTNWQGTKNLLEAISKTAPSLQGFIYVSSLSAAGPSFDGHLLKEEETPRPVSHYGESKLAAERETEKFSGRFPVVVIRPAVVYGPGDREILQLIRLVQHRIKLHPGWSKYFFSAVYVSDVVEAMLLAARKPAAGWKTYYISDGRRYSWEEALAVVSGILGKKAVTIRIAPGLVHSLVRGWTALKPNSNWALYQDKIKELTCRHWVCDISRAREELGFKPHFDFSEGMKHTITWYRKQGWL